MSKRQPAKICAPDIRHSVDRPRLYEKLEQARQAPALWISAPGGAGKTTLVSTYIRDKAIEPLWYQVDERDADPAVFFQYMARLCEFHGITHKLPVFGNEHLPALPTFAAIFFEELFISLPEGFVLVFDNLQKSNNSLFDVIVQQAITQIGRGGNLFCISREVPGENYAGHIASRHLVHIDQAHLRFEHDEIASLVTLLTEMDMPQARISELLQKSGGWAAGLIILLTSPKLLALEPKEFMVPGSVIFDFYESEYFSSLPNEEQRLLVALSIFNDFTIESAVRLLESEQAEKTLFELIKKNYFITAYGDKGGDLFYRLHPLFKSFLSRRLSSLFSTDELREINQRAISILIETQREIDAIDILVTMEQWDTAIPMILGISEQMIISGQTTTLKGWLDKIPDAFMDEYPWLLFYQGMCHMVFDIGIAHNTFIRAAHAFKKQNDETGIALSLGKAAGAISIAWKSLKPGEEVERLTTEFLGRKYRHSDPMVNAILVEGMIVFTQHRAKDPEALHHWLTLGMESLPEIEDPNVKLLLTAKLLYVNFHITGDNRICLYLIEMGNIIYNSRASEISFFSRAMWKFFLMQYYMDTRQTSMLNSTYNGLLAESEKEGVYYLRSVMDECLTIENLIAGNLEKADEYLEHQRNAIRDDSVLQLAIFFHGLSWREFVAGNFKAAIDRLQHAIEHANDGGSFAIYSYAPLFSRYYQSAGDMEGAWEMLSRAKQCAENMDSQPMMFHYLLLSGYFHFLEGDMAEAEEHIRRCLEMCKEEHYLYAGFAWSPDILTKVCHLALENDIHADIARSLIRRLRLPPPADNTNSDTWPALCRICCLGEFSVTVDDQVVTARRKLNAKPWQLLMVLISQGGKNVPEETIADYLWQDSDGDAARSAFSTTLQRLRQLLGQPELVLVESRKVSLNPKLVQVDIFEFEKLVDDCLNSSQVSETGLNKLLDVYKGSFLRDQQAPPFFTMRNHLQRRFARCIRHMAEIKLREKDREFSEKIYISAIEKAPLAEVLYQGFMELCLKTGNVNKGVDMYRQLLSGLKAQGLDKPLPETALLFQKIMA